MGLIFITVASLDDRGVRRVKKIIIYFLLGISLLILMPFAFVGLRILFDLSNPLRRSVERIREDILEITPLGMSMDDAIEILEVVRDERNWGRLRVNTGIGVSYGVLGLQSRPEDRIYNRLSVTGEHSLRMHLGGYSNFFGTGVSAWWAFDENKELIAVYVRKQITGW